MMSNNISPHVFSFLLVKVIMQLIILSLAAMILIWKDDRYAKSPMDLKVTILENIHVNRRTTLTALTF